MIKSLGLVKAEPLFQPAFNVGTGKVGDQRWRRGKQHRIALADRGAAKRDGEMRLTDVRRSRVILPGVRHSKFGSSIRL